MIGWLLAAQIAIVAHASDTATACAPLEVSVAARAAGTVAPRLRLPAGSALQVLRSTMTSHLEPDGAGQPFAVTEATYLIAVRGIGRVTLPGIIATVGAQRAVSAPLSIMLHAPESDADDPQVLVRASLDVGGGERDTVYVGQQVDYVVDVQLNEDARRRLRRNPTFFPPEMPAVLAYDVAPPAAVARTGRACFESLRYRRALFPLFTGRTVIPPAALSYAIPVSPSFFSREETHELRTDSVRIVAIEPPAANRPADYAGATGSFRASARLGSPSARMGDPLVLTVRVEGTGNVKLLPRPAFSVDWADVAPGEERVEVDTTHARVNGAKEFDWLLTPRRAGHAEIPVIRYPYFDPERVAYDVALTASIGLDVASAALATADTAVAARLAIRSTLREERGPPLSDRPAYWILLALAPLPATLRRVRRRRGHSGTGTSAIARLRQGAAARTPMLARDVRRLYLDALRERLPSLAPVTARLSLARQLRRAGVTDATADAAELLLERLDSAAFSGGGMIDPGASSDALRVAREIDAQAVRVRAAGGTSAMLAMLCVAGASTVLLALPPGVVSTFADGVRAYQAGDVPRAERQFARSAAGAPRAVDAWANLGTAALAAHDSARAAAAWQRALRLDPLDTDSRERLALLTPAIGVGAPGFVPPLPINAVALTALGLWVAAWLVLAVSPARRPAVMRPLAGGAIVLAVLGVAGALELHDRLTTRDLGVLRASRSLLDGPMSTATAAAAGVVGDVGRLGAREGAWVRFTLDGTRAGWVPVASVLLLDDAASGLTAPLPAR